MKRVRLAGFLLVFIFFCGVLSGCSARQEPQNRNYIMCMGIDLTDDGWRISYGFPDLAALTGTDSSSAEPVRVVEAETIQDAALQLDAASDKIADYSQLPVILIGESLAENAEKMTELVEELKQEKGIRRTVMIGRCANTAEEVVALDASVNGSVGVYIYELCQNNYEDRGYHLSVLEDFAGGRVREDCVTPVFEVQDEQPVVAWLK